MILSGACIIFFFESLKELPALETSGFTHLYTCSDSDYVTNVPSDVCSEETWSVMYSFYFTIVTLGTVGYGDNAPKTVMSRFLVILFILLGVLLFSNEIENLIRLYQLRQIGNPPYAPKFQHSKHLLIAGNPTFAQLTAILREILHEDHIDSATKLFSKMRVPLHIVIFVERDAKCVKELVQKLQTDSIFAARVTFVAGDVTRMDDLERAHASSSISVLIVSDKHAIDSEMEDSVNVMRVLAIRRHCGPKVRCLALILRAESVCHMLAAGLHPDDVICEHVIKMGALAQSTLAPGMSTLLANLASSLSESVAQPSGSNNESKCVVDVPPSDRNAKTLASTFAEEYFYGITKEIYQIRLSSRFCDLTFAQATANIFKESQGHVILIAVTVNRRDSDEFQEDGCVLLSPGNDLTISEWSECFVIAEDMASISKFGVNVPETFNIQGIPPSPERTIDHHNDNIPFIGLWTPTTLKTVELVRSKSSLSEPFRPLMVLSNPCLICSNSFAIEQISGEIGHGTNQ
nr:Voltagegated Ion Channel (VIC) Superfamily putative [Albugo laibachii Nc14]|eukprot:CCA17867.1 Voltagegated Ion Channel (VIC) Superfamily putative [Albugo laibachii Nc14]